MLFGDIVVYLVDLPLLIVIYLFPVTTLVTLFFRTTFCHLPITGRFGSRLHTRCHLASRYDIRYISPTPYVTLRWSVYRSGYVVRSPVTTRSYHHVDLLRYLPVRYVTRLRTTFGLVIVRFVVVDYALTTLFTCLLIAIAYDVDVVMPVSVLTRSPLPTITFTFTFILIFYTVLLF